jgi:phytanoyl-CoA hydroxylase
MQAVNAMDCPEQNSAGSIGISQAELRSFYEANGFLVLRGFFQKNEIAELERIQKQLWVEPRNSKIVIDILTEEELGKRVLLKDAPAEIEFKKHKINDAYLELDELRSLLLSRKVSSLISGLLDGPPLIINSLYFVLGSEQDLHFDSWFMSPPVEDKMAVLSISIDDQTDENGPLMYVPGSHMIPKYRFSNGGLRVLPNETEGCLEHLRRQLAERDLQTERFFGKSGDAFVWHSQLLHGGSPRKSPNATRRSLVVHYWRNGDLEATNEFPDFKGISKPSYEGYYLDRGHPRI